MRVILHKVRNHEKARSESEEKELMLMARIEQLERERLFIFSSDELDTGEGCEGRAQQKDAHTQQRFRLLN